MPLRNIRMNFSKRNVQTTAYPTFTTTRRTNPNFSMNTGCCIKSRNPLIGWRKEKTCCEPCFCTQVIQETSTIASSSVAVGDSVTGNASGATGTIVGITGSSPDRGFTIQLDDCDDPFTTSDNPAGGGSITIGSTTITSGYIIGPPSRVPCISQNTAGWQEVFKNVNGPDCCLPRNRSIQNTARSSPAQTARNGGVPYKVSGKIDKRYNHNYRQYLRKRCKLAYYDQKGQSSFTFNNTNKQNNIGQAACCGTYCRQYSNVATYKRSNWGFRRQGAVTANGYIASRGFKTANFCCCPCTQVVAWDPTSGGPAPAVGDAVTQTGGASGIIISITGGGSGLTATIRLDDCNKPFTNGGLADLFVNGADQGTSGTGVTANEVIPCGPYSGRQRDYPQDPQNNPKNYNKK